MVQRTENAVNETRHDISKNTRFKFRLIKFFRRDKAQRDSSSTASALSSQPDQPRTTTAKKVSRSLAAEGRPPAHSQRNLADTANRAIDGDVGTHDQVSGHREDGSRSHTTPSPPPALTRDLWKEAWNSTELNKEARFLLTSWNVPPSETSNEQRTVSNENKSTKRRDRVAGYEHNREIMANKANYVEEVIRMTKKRLEEYQNRWGTETETTALGQARKIMISILTFKQLVEVGLKFDPTGYASCAWAVVSFGLTLVENDKNRMDQAFEASAACAHLLARYSKIESYFRQNPPIEAKQETEKLEDAIVGAYVAILNYSAAVKKAWDESGLSRFKESFKALTENPIEDLKKTMRNKDDAVKEWEVIVDRAYETRFREDTKTRLEIIREEAAKMIDTLTRLEVDAAAMKRNLRILVDSRVLDWLSPSMSSSTQKHQELRDSIEKIGESKEQHWFLQKPEYVAWKKYPQSALWLHAPPGYGKSSLCSTIIQDLAETHGSENPRQQVLVYWYFQSNNMGRQDLRSVLRSFLRGLLASSPENKFLTEVNEWLLAVCGRDPPPDQPVLLKKVKDVIRRLHRDVFIVMDGLDEIPQWSKDVVDRKDILDLVSGLIRDENPNLHIIVASTSENDIRECLVDDADLKPVVKAVNVEDGLRNELHELIDRTMDKEDYFRKLSGDLKARITKKLKWGDGKDGTQPGRDRNFRWATSLLDDLRDCCGNEREIKTQLKKVPNSMAQKYEKAFKTINERYHPNMRLAFIWLLRHKRVGEPLTVAEVAEAARLDSTDQLTTLLPGWLVRKYEQTIMSANEGNGDEDESSHRYIEFDFSVKEHLEARCHETPSSVASETGKTAPSWFIFTDQAAHLEMATRCLRVLLKKDGRVESGRSPLRKYAAQHWHEHYLLYAKAFPDKENPEIVELDGLMDELFAADGARFGSWISSFNPDTDFELSDFDLEIEDDEEEDDDDSSTGTQTSGDSDSSRARVARGHPVYYAVKLKLLDMAVKMIKNGCPCARPGREGTVLQLALYHGYWEVVETLLHCCDDPQDMVKVRDGPHGTPLYIASAKAQDDRVLDIVRSLIDKGARADGNDCKQDGKYGTALHGAAYFGHVAAVRLLLDEGVASVDQEGGMFGTALHTAAARGHNDTIKLLLDHEANPTIISGPFGSSLQVSLAYGRGSQSTTNLLLEAIEKHGIESGNRSGTGWRTAFDRFKDSNETLLRRYRSLFPVPSHEEFPIPKESDLDWEQVLLAGVLESWDLRGMHQLSLCQDRLAQRLLYQTPAQEQLENIKKALPDFKNCLHEHELNRRDFCYKALFWSGINYILERLEPLVERAMASMAHSFRRAGIFPSQAYEYLGDIDLLHAMRRHWLGDPRMRYEEHMEFMDRLDFDYSYQMRWRERLYMYGDYGFKKVDMDLSDKIVLEMTRQQQLLQKRLLQGDQGGGKAKSLNKGEGSMTKSSGGDIHEDEHNDTEIHLIVDNLLPLLKEIVVFGTLCDKVHRTTARHGTDSMIKDLTFEVFAALVRLAVSLNEWVIKQRMDRMDSFIRRYTDNEQNGVDTSTDAMLAQTVHLLGAVRLPRITTLAAAVVQKLPDLQNDYGNNLKSDIAVGSEAGVSSKGDGLQKPPMFQDAAATTLNERPASVRQEFVSILDQLRDGISDQVQQLIRDTVRSELERQQRVQEDVAEARSMSSQRGGWYRGWSASSWGTK